MESNLSSASPERWQQVSEILQRLMEVAGEEQDQLLDQLCDGDEALKQEVLSFLNAHDEAGGFLDGLDDDRTHLLLQADLPEARDIGPYRVLGELGCTKADLASVQVWLNDIGDIGTMNAVWDEWVDRNNPPARATGGVRLARAGMAVEMIAIAQARK